MSNEIAFFAYLLEKYAEYKNENTADMLAKWEQSNLIEYIMQMYQNTPKYLADKVNHFPYAETYTISFRALCKTIGLAYFFIIISIFLFVRISRSFLSFFKSANLQLSVST